MVYGITGAGSGLLGRGNLYKPGTMTGTNPVVVAYDDSQARVQHRLEQRRAERRSDVAAEHRRRILEQDPRAPTRCSAAGTRSASTSWARISSRPTTARTPAGPAPATAARRRAPRRSAPPAGPCCCAIRAGLSRRRSLTRRTIPSRRPSTRASTSTTPTGRSPRRTSTASASSANWASRWRSTSATWATRTSAAGPPGT